MFVHTVWECCSSQPYTWGTFPKISSHIPFTFCPRFLTSWFRFLFAHTVPASRVPIRLMVAKCCKKRSLVSSEQHPRAWSRSHMAVVGLVVLAPYSHTLTTLSAKLHVHWGNAGACRYFPTCLHSSSSSADGVLSVHIHKCCDLFDAQIGTFMHLLQAVNLRPGVYLQMHLCN